MWAASSVVAFAGNPAGAGVRDGLGHTFEKFVVGGRVTAVTRICLMMDMLVRVAAAERRVVDVRRIELDQLGLAIDPDDCLIVITHGVLSGGPTIATCD